MYNFCMIKNAFSEKFFISNNVRFYVTKAIEIVDKKLVIRIECKSPQTRRVSFVVHNQYKEH